MDLYAPAGERTITPPRSPRLYDSLDRLSSDCCFSTKKAPPKLCTKDVFFSHNWTEKQEQQKGFSSQNACMHASFTWLGLACLATPGNNTHPNHGPSRMGLFFGVSCVFPSCVGLSDFSKTQAWVPKLDFFVVVVVFMIFLEMCRKLRLAQAGRIESKLIVGNWELEGRGPRGPTDRQQLGDGREVLWCKQTCWNKLDTPGGSATIALTHPPWKRLYGRREKQGWVGVKKRT